MPFGLWSDRERPDSPGVSTRRLEAFSDGVFAIAITLLALNLQVPELDVVTPHALVAGLTAKWPTYLSFLLSFVTLLIAWVYYHRLLQGAKHAGTALLFANGVLLLVVSSVPFPTALLGAYLTSPADSVVAAIYAGYIGVLNLTYNLLWWVVEQQRAGSIGMLKFTYNRLWRELLLRQSTNELRGWRPPTSMILTYLGFPCYVIAVGIAFWSPVATLVICGALWVVWTIEPPMPDPEQ